MTDATLPTRATGRFSRSVSAVLLALAVSIPIGITRLGPESVRAVAGIPGSPGAPTILFTEDFEHNSSSTVDPPVLITGYTGATGQTYTASPYFANFNACNGFILSRESAPASVSPGFCGDSQPSWNALRILSEKLTNAFGASGDRFTVASYTGGEGLAPDDYLQAETVTPIPLPPGGAYLTASIDTGAYFCDLAGPNYFMYLTDAAGTRHQVVSTGINPCTDPDAVADSSIDGRTALLVRTVGDAPQMIDSPSVKLEIENRNIAGLGNDATFDNLQLLDVSPQLDKAFESPVPYGTTSTVTFTLTNTYSPNGDGTLTQLDPKPGWQFTDQLPAGLTVVGSPSTGSGSEACANFDGSGTGGSTVSASGDLSADQAYCTVLVEVAASAPGEYTNLASDVTTVGLIPPSDAAVAFTASPAISIRKSATLVDVNDDAVADVGDSISYSFVVRNIGNVPLIDVAISDPVAGLVTCPSPSLAVGGSLVCNADAPYAIDQAEVDAGRVFNTATVTAANSFDPATTVTSNSNVTTVLVPAPKLSFVKTAETPVDVNSSGLIDAGDTIRYIFTVTNTGNVTVSNVAVTDNRAGSVTCGATILSPGETTNCDTDGLYAVTEADELAGSVVNTASATATTPGGDTFASNTASATTAVSKPAPALVIVKTADPPVDVNASGLVDAGDTIQYRFRVTNSGNVPIGNMTVTDDRAGPVTCDTIVVAPGASTSCVADAVYIITVADQAAASVVNVASASGIDPDGGVVTSPADSTTTAVSIPAPSLVIDKTADSPVDVNGSSLTDAGDTIQYRFVITNNGNVPIGGIGVTDGLVGPTTCAATVLDPNDTTTCAADEVYTITSVDVTNGSVTNQAAAAGLDPDGGTVTSNTDSTTTVVATPVPSLVIDKSADPPVDVNASGLVDAGDTIQYRFVITNNGNVPIDAINISDGLAGPVSCAAMTLDPGTTTACAADSIYTITEADEVETAVVNNATAVGLDPDGGTVASNIDSTITGVDTPAPSLSFAKTAGTPTDVNQSTITDAGDTIHYTFTVTNTGNVPISGVVVIDELLGAVTCVTTDLMVGHSTECAADAEYTVTGADQSSGSVNNTASATGVDPDGGAVGSNSDSTATAVDAPAPALLLTKTASTPADVNSSGLVDAGDTIDYTFTVTNTGNVPISSVWVDDRRVGVVSCGTRALAVGVATDCVADKPYTVTGADETSTRVDNTATAYGRSPNNVPVPSNTASTSTPVDFPTPSLAFVKAAEPPVDVNSSGLIDAGDTIQYTFVVTNTGNVPVSGVRVADDRVGSVTCQATSLSVSDATACAADSPYVVTADDEAAGNVENIASADGRDPDGETVSSPTDNSIIGVVTPEPALAIVKRADDPLDVNNSGLVDAGDTIQYRFVVTNTGNVPLSRVAVIDELAGSVTCEAVALAVDASTDCVADASYTVTDADETRGMVRNVAHATGADPDGEAVASAPDSTTSAIAVPAPSLVIDKSADTPVDVNGSGLVDAGDTIQYRFTVINNGNVPIAEVAISDELAGSATCEGTELAIGAGTDCVADSVYTVTEADEQAGRVVNTATVIGVDPDGEAVRSAPDSDETNVATPRPSLVIDKSADAPFDANESGLIDAGDTIGYRFAVTNAGNVPIGGVRVVDDLAGPVTCDHVVLAVGQTTGCVADDGYTITKQDEMQASVVNVAVAHGDDPDRQPVGSRPDETTTGVSTSAPALTIDKIADKPVDVNSSGLTDAGDTIRYSFVVTNVGNVPIAAIEVTDQLAGPVTCAATNLAVGESSTCTADTVYTVTPDDETAETVENVAWVSGLDPNNEPVRSAVDSTTTAVSVPRPSLLFEKFASFPTDANGSGIVDAGDTIQYSFTVANQGNVRISRLLITDELVGSVTCATHTLEVNAATDCVADGQYVITVDDQSAGEVKNVASASGDDPNGVPVLSNDDATITAVETPTPAVSLRKEAMNNRGAVTTGPVVVGDQVHFRFMVSNTGNVMLTTIDVADPMVGAVACESTNLAVGATTRCTSNMPHTVTAADAKLGSMTNTASVFATGSGDQQRVASNPSSVTIEVRPISSTPATGFDADLLVRIGATLFACGSSLLLAAAWFGRRVVDP